MELFREVKLTYSISERRRQASGPPIPTRTASQDLNNDWIKTREIAQATFPAHLKSCISVSKQSVQYFWRY
jgi:hypothetical protein